MPSRNHYGNAEDVENDNDVNRVLIIRFHRVKLQNTNSKIISYRRVVIERKLRFIVESPRNVLLFFFIRSFYHYYRTSDILSIYSDFQSDRLPRYNHADPATVIAGGSDVFLLCFTFVSLSFRVYVA